MNKPNITQVQQRLLEAMMPNHELKIQHIGHRIVGFINKQQVCRENTWRALLRHDYISDVDNFTYKISPKGRELLQHIKEKTPC